MLREAGRNETVGGGEILDVAPVLPASKATPDRDMDRSIDEHGFVTVDDLLAWTGERREPTLGQWIVAPAALRPRTQQAVRERVAGAGELGLDVATLDERERAVLPLLDGIAVDAGRASPGRREGPAGGPSVPRRPARRRRRAADAVGVDKVQLRELVRRKLVVERDSLYFHPTAIDTAAHAAARAAAAAPGGLHLCQFREALGNTRKHAVPLAAELDATGYYPTPRRPSHRRPEAADCLTATRYSPRQRAAAPGSARAAGPCASRPAPPVRLASGLRDPHVVGDHFTEVLRIGEQPSVRALDDRALDPAATHIASNGSAG